MNAGTPTPSPSNTRVGIVTPVLNGAAFIRETIESVLAQTHLRLEYLVLDGGSTDGTIEILRSYGNRVRWESRKDAGQSDAIARGIAQLDAAYVGYLNADDVLEPNAIATLARALDENPYAGVAYADALHIDESGTTIAPYPTQVFDAKALERGCFICQPATLLRRTAYEEIGGVDTRLHFAMDYDLWLRMATHTKFAYIPQIVARSRMHRKNKTLACRGPVYREIFRVLLTHKSYVPYAWIAGYSDYLLHRTDQFFRRNASTKRTAVLAFFLGMGINFRRPEAYLRDWVSHRSSSNPLSLV
jgi:glycosyltransferase involved in cell wall biosynthesis